MYPSHIPLYYNYPYNQEAYLYSTPFQEENYFYAAPDERQFGGPPPFAPPGQGPAAGPPTSPPPSFVPQQQVGAYAVDPGGIARCLFRYTYVWLRGFQQFWFYPTFVGRTSVSGWRWTGFRWVYFGISLRQIQSFTCH
ncbi:hypothetical protein HFZ78_14095 [Priestia megaterium]|uniref:Transporter n=1 Tax=Priestia megaterium TaxID=1404 RepID=A0A6H1P2P6_PRIMG|nr:hypothetical protein [Priestia megaterium]QIZ07722.1 hypothetical protein HFZ78_14095 [Priestia megaterium]